MKIVVSCDAILDRDYYLEAIEAALEVVSYFEGSENCELYSVVHNQGSIVGPVEARKIHSTFMSNFVKSWSDLLKNNYLIPNATKNLFIPCSIDLIINISRGFSHGIKKCENTKMISFIVEDINKEERKKSFKEKIFSMLVKSYQRNSLAQIDELMVSSKSLIPSEYHGQSQEVMPPVKLGDYKILPDAMFQRDYILLNVEPHTEAEVQNFINQFEAHNIKFKFIGKDDHLAELPKKYESYFFGNRCSGEMAPLLCGAKYIVDLEKEKLPVWSLKAMASGRPIFSKGNNFISFGEGFYEIETDFTKEFLAVPEFDNKKVRGRAVAYDELKFKHLLKNKIVKLMDLKVPNENPTSCC